MWLCHKTNQKSLKLHWQRVDRPYMTSLSLALLWQVIYWCLLGMNRSKAARWQAINQPSNQGWQQAKKTFFHPTYLHYCKIMFLLGFPPPQIWFFHKMLLKFKRSWHSRHTETEQNPQGQKPRKEFLKRKKKKRASYRITHPLHWFPLQLPSLVS